jgi:hypothetical protein
MREVILRACQHDWRLRELTPRDEIGREPPAR